MEEEVVKVPTDNFVKASQSAGSLWIKKLHLVLDCCFCTDKSVDVQLRNIFKNEPELVEFAGMIN